MGYVLTAVFFAVAGIVAGYAFRGREVRALRALNAMAQGSVSQVADSLKKMI